MESESSTDTYVLPRPVSRLPDYANARSRQSLADKLAEAFGLSSEAAGVVANAVVNPSDVRRAIGDPLSPEYERIAVPGGTLRGIRTFVWARRIMPDPRNPRTLPSRRHPFAVDPGTGADESKFRPLPEPVARFPEQPERAELAVEIESRHHIEWASRLAAEYVQHNNDWADSIALQGVMEAVWLVPTTYLSADGSVPVSTLVTAEGSSRATGVHKILGVRSSDVPYEDSDQKIRGTIKRLNAAFDRGDRSGDVAGAIRCEIVPALILVGFEPHQAGVTGFPTAVKSFVALRHVDRPTPWGEGPENEALADEVLDELYRQDLISQTQRDYFAGSCTRAEAVAARLSPDPAVRATSIVGLFTTRDERFQEAIRMAVTSQSTRKKISAKLMNELATALILRALASEPAKVDRIRRYLRHSISKAAHRVDWTPTNRTTSELVIAATDEVQHSMASGNFEEPGPASLELSVRAAYPLLVHGALNADRGSANNDQPDRRHPGEVLDAMRRTHQGVIQLGRSIDDFDAGRTLSAVDEQGKLIEASDGSGSRVINDLYLRREFPPPGKAKVPHTGDTAAARLQRSVADLGAAVDQIESAFARLRQVVGDDGASMVDAKGVEPRLTETWRKVLRQVDDELTVWSRAYRKRYETAMPVAASIGDPDDEVDTDAYEETDDEEDLDAV